MFWRLFITYLLLVLIAVGLVGLLILQRDRPLFFDLANEVGIAVFFAVAASIGLAYLAARRFARPLSELTDGARRLADGDLGHTIRVSGSREHTQLADTFNAMSSRLAATFAQTAHDHEQLRTILSGMVEGVIAVDHDQNVLFANERAGTLLEFNPQSAVDRKLWEVARQRGFQEILEKGLLGTGPYREELDLKGPIERSLAVYVSRLPGQRSPGAVVVIHDTTELRKLERMRQDFVANVSHELKTPLAVIKSNVEALQDGAAEDPAAREMFLGQAAQEADRLEALIQDLLSLARIESGEQGWEMQPVPLDRAILDCLERHQARAEMKSHTLVEVPPPNGPPGVPALADPDALRQVLDNLVDNAIKYTRNGGTITVRWSCAGEHVGFEVEDTGAGIGDRDLPRIFERFYRVDKARSREVGGTGLGLAIVKHLVQAMNGTIRVASRPGKGTTFKVALPRAQFVEEL
jgi:two-component system, OmpR family, phosphate regulon sensor histidine kinase PhoR